MKAIRELVVRFARENSNRGYCCATAGAVASWSASTVVGADELGHTLAWKILKSWPVR